MIASVLHQPAIPASHADLHTIERAKVDRSEITKTQQDLLVLRYMAHRVTSLLDTLVTDSSSEIPAIFTLPEGRERLHRVVLFQPLLTSLMHKEMAFVGFVSGRQAQVDPDLNTEMFAIDQHMLRELAHMPGIFSYSSFELRPGSWFNLVVFENWEIKNQLRRLSMHQRAAYQLAPQVYEWIRIHNGSLPAGLAGDVFDFHSTKYYAHQPVQQRLVVQEVAYPAGV